MTVETFNSTEQSPSSLYMRCKNAFSLITEGKEKQARELFPMESYLLGKYFSISLEDFRQLLSKKLELH